MASPSRTQRPVTHDMPGIYPQDIRTSVDSTRRTIFGHGMSSIVPDQQKMTEGEGTRLEDNTTEDGELCATSKALQTPEILEHIVSFLPGLDLITAGGVNKFFYNCIVNAPATPQTLFFRLDTKPLPPCWWVFCRRRYSDEAVRRSVTLGLSRNAGLREDDRNIGVTPCVAVLRLCPVLQPRLQERKYKNRAITSEDFMNIYENLTPDRAKFAAQLTEMTRLGGDMLLADPPVKEVDVFLRYAHTNSAFAVSVRTTVKQDSPITLGGMMQSAKQAKEMLWIEEEVPKEPRFWCKCRWTRSCEFHREMHRVLLPNASIQSVVTAHMEAHGGSFVLDLEQSWVDPHAIVPTDQEWETMYEVRARPEVKKTQRFIEELDAYGTWDLLDSDGSS